MTLLQNAELLRVDRVSKVFGGHKGILGGSKPLLRAVDSVSFNLDRGETLGLVGESGSGKSTLGRLVLRLLDSSDGSITFEGKEISTLSPRAVRGLRQRMQMVFQDPYGSLDPRMTAGDIIAEPLLVHGTPKHEIGGLVRDAMRQVGLSVAMASRYPHEFSGGQRQRIGIARAIVLRPSLLVLDEPVSALDVSVQAQILNLLRDLQRKLGLAYLFIAHDLSVVRHVSDRVAVMYLGRIIEIAARDHLYENPRHPYTISLLSAVPVADPVKERSRTRILMHGEIGSAAAMPTGCSFHKRCFRARLISARPGVEPTVTSDGGTVPRICASEVPALRAQPGRTHAVACHFADDTPPPSVEH
ncbi:ABC transporter ATP-binding protein [Roseomonas marmotae]|uniref:ATP-binding cassette domain-containing protein n=1 Tax=Roseomonas marmotae TaxID=2768161 RepID=A0ABS3KDA7_9PROT|nr:oligopeptide/dipeptide ABC transporter ATP-binding protein [Roseomonas marmotae]MBO1074628.1 ATP-binding cassette domain-containing protein [Roseomonas marmotae]QTI81649.1 ATP-binding cassette domain-containing protein [Roseomonas marmotae]